MSLEIHWTGLKTEEKKFVVKPWEPDTDSKKVLNSVKNAFETLEVLLKPVNVGVEVLVLSTAETFALVRINQENVIIPISHLSSSNIHLSEHVEKLLLEIDLVLQSWTDRYAQTHDTKVVQLYLQHTEALLVARKRILESHENVDGKWVQEAMDQMEKGNLALLDIHLIRNDHGPLDECPSLLWKRHLHLEPSQQETLEPLINFWNLQFEIKAFDAAVCAKGELIEVETALYDAQEQRFFTEWSVVILAENGCPLEPDFLRQAFVRLSPRQWGDDIYLVCRIVRRGRLTISDKDLISILPNRHAIVPPANLEDLIGFVRKPFGVGVLKIKSVLGSRLTNSTVKPDLLIHLCNDETTFSTLHDFIISKRLPEFSVKRMMLQLQVRLNDEVDVVKISPVGFPEVALPTPVQRNTVYLTLESGMFPKHQNVEVCIQVRRADGVAIENCVFPLHRYSTTLKLPWTTTIVYTKGNINWNETFRIEIPPQDFAKCHVFLGFRQVTRKKLSVNVKVIPDDLFAFAFLPLMTEKTGTVLADGSRTLSVFKLHASSPFRQTFEQKLSNGTYSNWWWYLDEECSKGLHATEASLSCNTQLCSTYFTQNAALVNLIRWRSLVENSQGKVELGHVLQAFSSIGETDVISFFPEILLALSSMMEWMQLQKDARDANTLFNTFVFVLAIACDNRNPHLIQALEKHIERGLVGATVSSFLMESLRRLILNSSSAVGDAKAGQAMRCAIKVWGLIIKLARAGSCNMTQKQALLESLEFLLSRTSPPTILGAQSLALQHLGSLTTELEKDEVDLQSLSVLISKCLNAVVQNKKNTLLRYRWEAVKDLMKTRVWQNGVLFAASIEWLGLDLQRLFKDEDLEGWYDNVQTLLQFAHVLHSCMERSLFASLLPSLLELYHHPMIKNKSMVGGLLLDILCTISPSDAIQDNDTLSKLMTFLDHVLQPTTINKSWINLSLIVQRLLGNLLEPLARHCQEMFESGRRWSVASQDTHHTIIVSHFLHLLLVLLQNEGTKLNDQVIRTKMLFKVGDLQEHCADLLQQTWQTLAKSTGSKRSSIVSHRSRLSQVVPVNVDLNLLEFVGSIMRLGLNKQGRLRVCSVEMTMSVVEKEWMESHHLKDFAQCFVEEVEMIHGHGQCQEWMDWFNDLHEALLTLTHRHVGLKDSWNDFCEQIKTISGILNRLQSSLGEEAMWLMKLIASYQGLGLSDLANKHVADLVQRHAQKGQLVEAGLVLCQATRSMEWCDQKLEFYQRALSLFESAKAWEQACMVGDGMVLPLKQTFEHAKLSNLYTRMGHWYNKMMEDRYSFSFFRVLFVGQDWSDSLRDQAFVFKGGEWEKIGAFCDKLLANFPGASILRGPMESTGKWLSVTSVEPLPDWVKVLDSEEVELESFQKAWMHAQHGGGWKDPVLPRHLIQYYHNNQVSHFVMSRPIKKSSQKQNEFLGLWTERTLLSTEGELPGLLNFTKVMSSCNVELSPIENALEGVEAKTRELQDLFAKYSQGTDNVNPLTMSLNGAIDAPVNGGVAMYRKAFLCQEFVKEHSEWTDYVDRLTQAIQDQARVIDECLTLHGRLVPETMRPLHSNLVTQFHKNFAKEISQFSSKSHLIRSSSLSSNQRQSSSSGSLSKLAKLALKFKLSTEENNASQ